MLFIEIVLLGCSLFAVFLAVRSADTWNSGAKGIYKITRHGWVAICLGVTVFFLGVAKQVYQSRIEADKSQQIADARIAFDDASEKYNALREATIKGIADYKKTLEHTLPKSVPIKIGDTTIQVNIEKTVFSNVRIMAENLQNTMLAAQDELRISYEEHRKSLFD